jgi:type I restriction enzyme S subunit
MSRGLPFSLSSPPGWEVRRFGRVITRSQESGQPQARSLSVFIDEGVVPRDSRDDNFNRLGADLAKYLVVQKGDIVFNKLRTWQGGLGVSKFDGIVSPAYFVCRPLADADPRYLHFLLRSRVYLEELTRISKWMPPSQFDISWDDLRSLNVVVPPLTTQRAIADYLDRETERIDALIAAKRRMVKLLAERRAEAIGRVVLGFSSRDPSMPVPAWASALPSRWAITTLGRCLTRATYGFTNPMPTVADGPYLLTANDIGDGAIEYSTARRTSEEAYVTAITDKSRPHAGDVLVTKDGSLGRVARADGTRACINQSVALLRPSASLDSHYLVALLRSSPYQELMTFQAGGTTIKHIYVTRIVKMPVPLPPLEHQRRVASEAQGLDKDHDAAADSLERSIALLHERRQALVTAAVTGQLDILEAA